MIRVKEYDGHGKKDAQTVQEWCGNIEVPSLTNASFLKTRQAGWQVAQDRGAEDHHPGRFDARCSE